MNHPPDLDLPSPEATAPPGAAATEPIVFATVASAAVDVPPGSEQGERAESGARLVARLAPRLVAHPPRRSTPVTVVRGQAALRLVHDDAFGLAWDYLAATCPWTTVSQRRAWAATWFETYRDVEEPVIAFSGDGRSLTGLLALSRPLTGGPLVAPGDRAGAFAGWLAMPGDGVSFLTEALAAVGAELPLSEVRFDRIGPGAPRLDRAGLPPGTRVVERPTERAVIAVRSATAPSSVRQTPQRRGDAARWRRLAARGPVHISVTDRAAAIDVLLGHVAAWSDLRGLGTRGTTSFDGDPRRHTFLAEAAALGGILRALELRVGETLAAAVLGVRDGDTFRVVLVAHDPRLGRYSPGALLLRRAAEHLADGGVATIDLGPAAAWTERFATGCEETASLRVASRPVGVALALTRNAAALAGTCAGATGRAAARGAHAAWSGAKRLVRSTWSRRCIVAYALPAAAAARSGCDDDVAADRVEDLLLPGVNGGATVRPADARKRLGRVERGARSFSLTERGRLVGHAWLEPRAARAVPEAVAARLGLPRDAVLVGGVHAPFDARRRGPADRLVGRVLHEAVTTHRAPAVWALAQAADAPRRRLLERAGFRERSRLVETTVLGRTRRLTVITGSA